MSRLSSAIWLSLFTLLTGSLAYAKGQQGGSQNQDLLEGWQQAYEWLQEKTQASSDEETSEIVDQRTRPLLTGLVGSGCICEPPEYCFSELGEFILKEHFYYQAMLGSLMPLSKNPLSDSSSSYRGFCFFRCKQDLGTWLKILNPEYIELLFEPSFYSKAVLRNKDLLSELVDAVEKHNVSLTPAQIGVLKVVAHYISSLSDEALLALLKEEDKEVKRKEGEVLGKQFKRVFIDELFEFFKENPCCQIEQELLERLHKSPYKKDVIEHVKGLSASWCFSFVIAFNRYEKQRFEPALETEAVADDGADGDFVSAQANHQTVAGLLDSDELTLKKFTVQPYLSPRTPYLKLREANTSDK